MPDVMLDEVVRLGLQQKRPPEEIAGAVRRWQTDTVQEGRELLQADPAKWWRGTQAVDQDVNAALSGLGAYAQEREAAAIFPDPEQRSQFRSVLESSGNDPDRMDAPPAWQVAARKVAAAGANPVFAASPAQYGTIGSGPNTVAAYAMRPRGDGSGYEAFVQPMMGKDAKPVIVPISGDREAFRRESQARSEQADRDYEMSIPDAESMGFGGVGGGAAVKDVMEEMERRAENARVRLGVANDGPLSQVLHLQLDEALRSNKSFLDQLPQNVMQQITTRPLASLMRSFAQATAGATGIGKEALTAEGQQAVDVVTPGMLRSRFANNDEATPADMISQGIESAATLLGPALAGKALQVAGGLTRAGMLVRAGTAAANLAPKAGWGGFFATSYGGNYAGAMQEADALQASDPERAARIRSLAQWTSLAKAGIEMATERIFPDEARLMAGQRMPWESLVTMPFKEGFEEFSGTLGQNAVSALSGQEQQSPWEAAQGGIYGSLPLLGAGVAARAMPRQARPAVTPQTTPPAAAQPPAFEATPPEPEIGTSSAEPLISTPPPMAATVPAAQLNAETRPITGPPLAPDSGAAPEAGPLTLSDVAERAGTVDSGPDAGLFPMMDEDGQELEAGEGIAPEPPVVSDTPPNLDAVPETPDTLLEQRARVAAGTEPAMTVPGATVAQLPPELLPQQGDGLTAIDTPAGAAILPEGEAPAFAQAVQDGQLGVALGYGVAEKPAKPTGAIVMRNADGVEVKAAEVDANTRDTVLQTLHDRAQPGDTVAEEPLAEVAAKREGKLVPLFEAAPTDLARMDAEEAATMQAMVEADAADAAAQNSVQSPVPSRQQTTARRQNAAQPGQRTRTPRENARLRLVEGWRQIAREVTPQFGWTDSPRPSDIADAVSTPDSPITMRQHRDGGVTVQTRTGELEINRLSNGLYSIYSAGMRSSNATGTRSAGSQAYLAAFLWARNTGNNIISSGLTPINRTRRTSNMLSMALRRLALGDANFTNHSAPAPEQGLRWQGTHEDKLVDMLLREHDHVAGNVPELQDLSYDRRRRTFVFQGNPIGPEGIAGFQRNGVGSASIRRAVITRGLLDNPLRPSRSRSGGTAAAGQEGTRRRLPVAFENLLYSQPVNSTAGGLQAGGKLLGETTRNPAKVAAEAVTALNNAVPGLVSEQVHFVGTPADLLTSGYAAPGYFSAEDLQQMQGAEGFHDPRTGRTIVFTNQVVQRPGESQRSAVARVVLHERVGHDGLNRMLETDPEFAGKWDRLAARIPQAELDGISRQEGYEHLATDRAQLALEWMARQAENIETARLSKAIDGWTGLPRQMWEAFKSWLAKAWAGFARGPVRAHEVRELVAAARRAALTGTSIPTQAEGLQFSQGGTALFHAEDAPRWNWLRRRLNIQPGQPFRVNQLGWRALLTGSPLPRAMVQTVEATDRARRAADQAAAQIGRDLQSAIASAAERTGVPLATVHERVNGLMNGVPGAGAALRALDPVLHERAPRARNYLDDLSTAIANTLPVGDLRNTILGNLGTWMRRSYAAFDPASGWNYDALNAAARTGQQVNGVDAARILRDARAFLQAQSPQATPAEIEADMRDLMDRNTEGNAFAGTSTVRKNVSSLLARADIPAPLRALMGEETNALHRFTNSAAFQTQFLRRHEGQQALRTLGLANGLFSPDRGGVFVEQIPGTTGGTDQRWSPLSGLWTTPQLAEALQRTDGGVTAGTDAAGYFARALIWAGHEAKLNRVALNPDSWVVNMLGNVAAVINSGDVFHGNIARRIGEAFNLMRAGKARPGDVYSATAEALADANRAMAARLTASGVLGENFNLRDLETTIPRQLLQWVADDSRRQRVLGAVKGAIAGQASLRGLGPLGRLGGAIAGGTVGGFAGYNRIIDWQNKLAGYVMTAPDALGRLTGFMGNLETAHASGLSGNDAFRWASERTRNTFPDYGKLPAVVKQLSRLGVVGSFIAFQYEVYRNAAWNARYAVQEIRSGNPALRRRGAARMLGVASIGTLAAGGLGAIIAGLGGAAAGDDDRNKRWQKWFAAPWEKDAPLAFTRYDDKGVSYANTTYLLPQATMTTLVNAAAKGENPADAAARVVGALWEQFVGASVNLDPLITAYANVDRSGRPITNKDGIPGAIERADAAGQTILEPGYAQKLERITYALRDAQKKGRTYSLTEEALRLMGWRSYSRTWADLVKRRYQGFNQEHDALIAEGNKTLGLNLPGAQAKAVTETNAGLEQLRARVAEFEQDAVTLGIPLDTLRAARKETRPPKASPVRINPANPSRLKSVK